MATLEKAIVTVTEADAPITAVIGTRFKHGMLPQNPIYPAATYQLMTQVSPITHEKDVGPQEATFRISSFAKTYREARELADLVVDLWHGYTGTHGGIQIQGAFLISMEPMYDPDETLKVWQVACLFSCHFKW